MFKVAIRDDDTSYWTKPEELEQVYWRIWDKGMCVSLAVIPKAYKLFLSSDRKKMYHSNDNIWLGDNTDIVEFLTGMAASGKIEVMLHGFDHSYKVMRDDELLFLDKTMREKIKDDKNIKYVPECIHKPDAILLDELQTGKEYLGNLLKTNIFVFVPPSNALRKGAVNAVENLNMNISGTMTPNYNREVDIWSVCVYLKKLIWKLTKRDYSYPYVMRYRNHKELIGYALTPTTNMEKFWKQYEYCKRKEIPFTIATHYWEVLENKELYKCLMNVIDRVEKDNVPIVKLSDLLEDN